MRYNPDTGPYVVIGETIIPAPTMRDWFAAHALTGLITTPGSHWIPVNAAKEAYAYADAMIAERLKVRATQDTQ